MSPNNRLLTGAEPHSIKWTPRPNARGGSNGGAAKRERFFLPLSQCTLPATEAETGTKTFPGLVVDISGFSAYEWPSAGSSIAAVLFGWAAIVQLLALRVPGLDASRGFFALEIALPVLTIAGVSWLIYAGGQAIRYGALISYAAVLAYLGAAIARRGSPRHPSARAGGRGR